MFLFMRVSRVLGQFWFKPQMAGHLRASEVPSDGESEGQEVNQHRVAQGLISAGPPNVQLPWEQGIFRDIFAPRPVVSLDWPEPKVLVNVDEAELSSTPGPSVLQDKDKTPITGVFSSSPGANVFSKVIKCKKKDEPFEEAVAGMWLKNTQMWKQLFEASPSTTFAKTLQELDEEEKMLSLRDMFGSKSPHTIQKRASTLLRLFRWLQKQADVQGTSVEEPLLPSEEAVYKFCREISHRKKGKLAPQSVVQALKFVKFVLSIPNVENSISPRVQGLADRVAGEHEPTHQARDLTVLEVRFLEECVWNAELHIVDRFAAGVFLFQIFSRNRWSDIRHVRSLEFDFLEIGPEICGFLEGRAREVKQSNKKKKLSLFMPLVAPVRGVHPTVVWAKEWQKVAAEAGIVLSKTPVGPLLPATAPDGAWLQRSIDSAEASNWLTGLLRNRDPSTARVTTHSLKHTALGWLSKYGIVGETQTLLAHHSTGALSTLAYSRDALSGPLRQLEEMLKQVREGSFCPDATRSGYFARAQGSEAGASVDLGSWLPISKAGSLDGLPANSESTHEPLPATAEGFEDDFLGVGPLCSSQGKVFESPSAMPVLEASAPSVAEGDESPSKESEELDRLATVTSGLCEALFDKDDTQGADDDEEAEISPTTSADGSSEETSDGASSEEKEEPASTLSLPEGWSAIQNKKSTMLHLYKVGQTTLKCGKWISVNFVEMEKPSAKWLQCSRCFQE